MYFNTRTLSTNRIAFGTGGRYTIILSSYNNLNERCNIFFSTLDNNRIKLNNN